jgi:hypothetical protein
MSEMRRAARALVERRTESFESVHDLAVSRDRLHRALERARIAPDAAFETAWREKNGKAFLDATFLPSPRVLWILRSLSLAMAALLVLTAWVLSQPGEGAERFLLPLFAVLTILALPFLSLALASSREARESRIRRAIRVALMDADEGFPPQQKWSDED